MEILSFLAHTPTVQFSQVSHVWITKPYEFRMAIFISLMRIAPVSPLLIGTAKQENYWLVLPVSKIYQYGYSSQKIIIWSTDICTKPVWSKYSDHKILTVQNALIRKFGTT